MYGIIDIGSNTIRLAVYQINEGEMKSIFQKKVMAGLASYIDKENVLKEEGIEKVIAILKDFDSICSCVIMKQLFIIATASIRNVENTEEIVERIRKETNQEVQVLSGEEEARYDFVGATHYVTMKNGLVVDIGGGSTEFVEYENKIAKDQVYSLPFGSLNMFYNCVTAIFPTKEDEKEIRKIVRKELKKISVEKQRVIVGVGGSYRGCLKLYNDYYGLDADNKQMEVSRIGNLLHKLKDGKKVKIHRILRVVPDRVHTILPGMIVIDEINQYYQSKRVEISSWGVREGFLLEKCRKYGEDSE